MINILLCGSNGNMGRKVNEVVNENNDLSIAAGIDKTSDMYSTYPVFTAFSDVVDEVDLILDFSCPCLLDDMLEFATANSVSCVICTTGYSPDQDEKIKQASEKIAVFYSGNMSLGINLLIELAKKATKVLGKEFDIEIIEKHHNLKLDAPSGTALMIADNISDTLEEEPQYVYDRHSYRKKRSKNEIGIHSVRGGTIVGEHEVIFAGRDEVVTVSHQAQSKEVFAVGAVNAAVFLADKEAGMYDMSDLLSSKLG